VALIAGLLALTGIYSSAGNGYSAYSSLRTDRKGTKVLYDSFVDTGRFQVSRNYGYLQDLHAHGAAIFVVGISPEDNDFDTLEKLAQGNRLAVALEPEDVEDKKTSTLERRWGIHLKKLEESEPCAFAFDRAAGWIVTLNQCAAERSFGSGRIVLLADSRPLTNEGLVSDRNARFLASMVGASARIVFDESHLGMLQTGSALGLARKYRLQGLLWGFALLAGVFIWKTAEPFPPPPLDQAERTAITGRDAQTGFLRLLERHIPPARLVEECLREWRLTSPRKDLPTGLPAGDPVTAYRAIQRELTRK
jgi:hypothetical protein